MEKSLDPRVNRLDLQNAAGQPGAQDENWPTWEVFHQKKRGEHHIHVGIVHAADEQLALLFAKEQYGRRLKCANIWVIKSSNVFSLGYDDEDMFETTPDKIYREATGYKVRDKINAFKKSNKTIV